MTVNIYSTAQDREDEAVRLESIAYSALMKTHTEEANAAFLALQQARLLRRDYRHHGALTDDTLVVDYAARWREHCADSRELRLLAGDA